MIYVFLNICAERKNELTRNVRKVYGWFSGLFLCKLRWEEFDMHG